MTDLDPLRVEGGGGDEAGQGVLLPFSVCLNNKNIVNHFRLLRIGNILPDTGQNPRLTQIPMSAFFHEEKK
jgi:hypothetical protein